MGVVENLRRAAGRGEPPRSAASPAREKLAAAIARLREIREAISANAGTLDRLRRRRAEIEAQVEQSREELRGSKTLRRERIFDPSLPAPRISVRDAEDALSESEEALAELDAAIVEARDVGPVELQREEHYARMNIESAASQVMAENEDAIRRLCERALAAHAEFRDLSQSVDFLLGLKVIPKDVKVSSLWMDSHRTLGPTEASWRNSVERLKVDPAAPLPEA